MDKGGQERDLYFVDTSQQKALKKGIEQRNIRAKRMGFTGKKAKRLTY